MRIGTATLIRAPLERTLEWVAYHLNIGIDEMHLFFDDPHDPAIAALAGLPAVICYPCDERFWLGTPEAPRLAQVPESVTDRQAELLRRMLHGQAPDLDWFAHIDSDELIWAPGDIRKALVRECSGTASHVQMSPLEAVPPSLAMTDAFREVHLFKEQREDRFEWARRLHADSAFSGKRYLRGHVKGKPLVRLDGSIPRMRIHGPTPSVLEQGTFTSVTARELRVLHYDSGSFQEWREKWNNRQGHQPISISRARRRQTKRFKRALRAKKRRGTDLRQLYRREYMIPENEARILRLVGLLRKVEIPERMFELPGESRGR